MAERRMFALKIIDSDAFLDMSQSAQNLYFHLAMRADDDGFISNPKKIMRMIGSCDDDIRVLAAKRFILTFDTGIVVIKHWRIHNYIAKDRYTETIYKEEKQHLFVKFNGAYTDHPDDSVDEMYTPCIQNDDTGKVRVGKVRVGKVRVGKVSKGKDNTDSRHKYGQYQHVLLTDEQKAHLLNDWGEVKLNAMIKLLDEKIEEKGYKYKNFELTLRNWEKSSITPRFTQNTDNISEHCAF